MLHMPPQNSKPYDLPFGYYANFVNHPGVADIKIEPKSPRFLVATCGIFATSRFSRSASVRVHVDVRNGHGRAMGVGAAPRRRRLNEAIFDREFQFRESHTSADTKKTPNQIPDTKKNDFIYMYSSNPRAIFQTEVQREK